MHANLRLRKAPVQLPLNLSCPTQQRARLSLSSGCLCSICSAKVNSRSSGVGSLLLLHCSQQVALLRSFLQITPKSLQGLINGAEWCFCLDQQAVLPLLPLLLLLAALKHGQVQTSESSQAATDTGGAEYAVVTVIKGTHHPYVMLVNNVKAAAAGVKGSRGAVRNPVCTPPTSSILHITTIRV